MDKKKMAKKRDAAVLLLDVPDWDLGAPVQEITASQAVTKRKKAKRAETVDKFADDSEKLQSNADKPATSQTQKLKANKQVPATVQTPKQTVQKTAKVPKQSATNTTLKTTHPPTSKFAQLQAEMRRQLQGSRFRWINEQLYTTNGAESFDAFQKDPKLFEVYHQGFTEQVSQWPSNPVEIFISELRKLPPKTIVADMGCGDAKIARALCKHLVIHSFDLVAANKFITACDISHVPLQDESVDVVVFCLSLMGTNYMDFVKEGARLLRIGGEMKIAEVVSRFVDMKMFLDSLSTLGLKLLSRDDSNIMFVRLQFCKQKPEPIASTGKAARQAKRQRSEVVALKPCIYKKR